MLINKKIIISCTNAASLINFRGKLIDELIKDNLLYVITPVIQEAVVKEKLIQLGIKVFETQINRNGVSIFLDIKYTSRIIKIIKEVKPDLFFAYTFKPVIFGSIAAHFCKVKNINVMLTGLGYTFSDSPKNFLMSMSKLMLRISLRLNGKLKIIFQNKDDFQELLDKKILSKTSNAYIVNGSGVDLTHYNFSIPNLSNIQFVMFSRLIKSKGVIEFYDAASIIKKKYPEVKFVLAGGYKAGSTDSIENELFEKINNGDIINYIGWIDDVRSFILESSAVVLPSYYREGVPRSLLESLAMGRAVITTNEVGCKETVCNIPGEENGFAIPARNAVALASKMEYLINHPERLIDMGKKGRSYAEKKFDVKKVNLEMLRIFEI